MFRTLGYIFDRLKSEGVTVSRPLFNEWERAGDIPSPENTLVLRKNNPFGIRTIRIYTDTEIDTIIKKCIELKKRDVRK